MDDSIVEVFYIAYMELGGFGERVLGERWVVEFYWLFVGVRFFVTLVYKLG